MTVPNTRWGLILCSLLLLAACGQRQSPGETSGQTGADSVAGPKAITAAPDLGPPPTVPDTQFVIVDSMAGIKVNNEPVPRRPGAFDSTLATYWMQLYNSEKKLPSFLRFKYQGTVMMGARGNIMDQVAHVQDSLRNHISQDKYQQNFKQLDTDKQKELTKDFPILFQKQL